MTRVLQNTVQKLGNFSIWLLRVTDPDTVYADNSPTSLTVRLIKNRTLSVLDTPLDVRAKSTMMWVEHLPPVKEPLAGWQPWPKSLVTVKLHYISTVWNAFGTLSSCARRLHQFGFQRLIRLWFSQGKQTHYHLIRRSLFRHNSHQAGMSRIHLLWRTSSGVWICVCVLIPDRRVDPSVTCLCCDLWLRTMCVWQRVCTVYVSARACGGRKVAKPGGRPAGVVDTYAIQIICALFGVRSPQRASTAWGRSRLMRSA